MSVRSMRLLQLAVASSVFTLDRTTKVLIERFFLALATRSPGAPSTVEVIGDAVRFSYVRNAGVVFGIFGRSAFRWREELLIGFSLVTIAGLLAYLLATPPARRALSIGLALVLGGALGNLIDRWRFGYVVDFIDVSLYFTRWHVFNVADAAIVAGVGLMGLDILRPPAEAGRAPGNGAAIAGR